MSWPLKSISEVATVNPRMPKDKELPDEVVFLPMAAISERGEVLEQNLRPLEEVRKGFTYFERGDVLLAKITPCFENGKAAFLEHLQSDVGFGSTEFHVVRPNTEVLDGKYLFYMLWNGKLRHDGELNMTGSAGQRRVPAGFLERYRIPLPLLDTQRHIAKVLEQADRLRRQAQQMEAELERLAQALFVEMFGDPVANPKAWSKVSVSHFVEEFEGGKSLVGAGEDQGVTGYRVLKISAVTWGEFNPAESKPLPNDYQPDKTHFVRKFDLLFSRANTTELVGATSYVFDEHENLLLPDKLWRFVWRKEVSVSPIFVWLLFMNRGIRVELGKLSSGSGGSMKNISKAKLMSFKVIFPPVALQREFERKYLKLREALAVCRSESAEHERMFEALMQRAFKGELTPKLA